MSGQHEEDENSEEDETYEEAEEGEEDEEDESETKGDESVVVASHGQSTSSIVLSGLSSTRPELHVTMIFY